VKAMYPACFYIEENGVSVVFPDLNWLATDGDKVDEAMYYAIDCLAGYLYIEQKEGNHIPEPSDISSIDPVKVARELDPENKPGHCFVSYVTVDVDAYAKEHFEKAVKKTLTIPAWLNKLAMENNVNFSKVLQEALIKALL